MISADEQIEKVRNGETFLYSFEGGLVSYSLMRSKLGDGFHAVGDPSEQGYRSHVSVYRAVAINALSENKEVAADFISNMVSEKYQAKYATDAWISKELMAKRVRNAWELFVNGEDGIEPAENPAFMVSERGMVPLQGKPDGSSYVNEYIELMEAGAPLSMEYEIQNIVFEEAQAFFSGAKTEDEVAKIIQGRISIYLNE